MGNKDRNVLFLGAGSVIAIVIAGFIVHSALLNEPASPAPVRLDLSASASVPAPAPPPLSKPKLGVIINLPSLFARTKSVVSKKLSHYKITEHDRMPEDYPDPLQAGGEMRTYDIGQGMELNLVFSRRGYATVVNVTNTQVLGYTLDNSKDLFARFGIADLGVPFRFAPLAEVWNGRDNLAPQSEVTATVQDENGPVWQVAIGMGDTQ